MYGYMMIDKKAGEVLGSEEILNTFFKEKF